MNQNFPITRHTESLSSMSAPPWRHNAPGASHQRTALTVRSGRVCNGFSSGQTTHFMGDDNHLSLIQGYEHVHVSTGVCLSLIQYAVIYNI